MRRLTILLATVGAMLLLPAAAQATNYLGHAQVVSIEGTGGGEVTSKEGYGRAGGTPGVFEGSPAIECTYASPGPQAGVCENEMEEVEPGFSIIFLEAVADPESEFTGWKVLEGNVLSLCFENPEEESFVENRPRCFLYAEEGEDVKVTASFKFVGPSLGVKVEEGSGAVVSNPAGIECNEIRVCSKPYAENTLVTLTASPSPGYMFKSWKGCDSGGVNGRQCTVKMSKSKEVGAKFIRAFTLKGSKSGGLGIFGTSPGGINCGYACTSSTAFYKEGALTVKAKPAKNFHFVEFTGGNNAAASCNGVTAETCTITNFNADSVIEEVYAENAKNILTLFKKGGGQGFVKTKPTNINCGYTCTAAAAEFFASEEPEVTVTLNKGTTSVTWTTGAGTCTGNALTCKVPMSEAHELVAEFN